MARRMAIVRRIEPFPTGWQMEEKKPIVGHGGRGAFAAREERRFDNEFPPDANGLRYVRHNKSDPP